MQNVQEEEWRPIPSFQGYEASSFGRIRSVDRVVEYQDGRHGRYRGQLLKAHLDDHGYLMVGIRNTRCRVHCLVAAAFIGPRPTGLEVLHLDDVRTHNWPSNLRYGTQSDNMNDAVRNGTHGTGSKQVCKRGHDLTDPENVQITSQGSRQCLPCKYMLAAERRRAARAQHQATCVECGTEFKGRIAKAVYCSNACKVRAHRRRKAAQWSSSNSPTTTGSDVQCALINKASA